MGKPRTLDQLLGTLDQDIVWRKRELLSIKQLIDSSAIDELKTKTLLRAAVALLYAHWEGFVKSSATSYLEFVAEQGLRYDELSTNFLAIAMNAKLEEAGATNKPSLQNEVVDFFLNRLSERSNIQCENAIKTGSNLNSKNLRAIADRVGVDYSRYSSKEKMLDETLLHSRNTIAHGKYLQIDVKTYGDLHHDVINLMELMKGQIENAAILKSYVR